MIEKFLAEWLKEHDALQGQVQGVYPVKSPQARAFPCLVYAADNAEEDEGLENSANQLHREVIEVSVLGKEIADVDAVGRKLEDREHGINGYRGDVKGAWIQSLFVRQEIPEEAPPEPTGDESPLITRRYRFHLRYQTDDVPALT